MPLQEVTATAFAQYAVRIFGNVHTANTDAFVWWFYSRNLTDQMDAISQICEIQHYSVEGIMDTYWTINSTYFLDMTLQNQMIHCVDKISNGSQTSNYVSKNPYTDRYIFQWNPYTPRAFYWFRNLPEWNQQLALNGICNNVASFPPSFLTKTFKFLRQQGDISYSANIENFMNICPPQVEFTRNPMSNTSLLWYKNQNNETQRSSLIRICGNLALNSSELLDTYLSIPLIQDNLKDNAFSCLYLRDYDPVRLFKYYSPDMTETLWWFASRNVTMQRSISFALCDGVYRKRNEKRKIFQAFTIPELNRFLALYLNFLNSTNLIGYGAVYSILTDCVSAIYPRNYDVSAWYLNNKSTPTLVWLASQNSSTQIEFFNMACQDTSLNATQILTLYQTYGMQMELGSVVQRFMTSCTKIREADKVVILTTNFNTFIGLVVSSLCGVLVFAAILVFDINLRKDEAAPISRTATPFNAAIGSCLVSLVIGNVCYAMVWHFSLIDFVTGSDNSEPRQSWYLASEVSVAIWTLSYLYVCWSRSETILNAIWSNPKLVKNAFFFSPVLILSPVVSQTIVLGNPNIVDPNTIFLNQFSLNTVTYILQGVASAVLLFLDSLLLLSFTKFISNLQTDMKSAVTPRFLIISRYGIAASSLCFLYSSIAIVKPLMTVFNSSLIVYFKVALSVLMQLVTVILLLMKVALLKESMVKKQSSKMANSENSNNTGGQWTKGTIEIKTGSKASSSLM